MVQFKGAYLQHIYMTVWYALFFCRTQLLELSTLPVYVHVSLPL